MFFDNPDDRQLECPYCGRKLTALAAGEARQHYEVFKAGLFSKAAQMRITCQNCGGEIGINIKRWR